MEAFVAASDLPKSPGHPFHTALNRLLAEHGFDAFVEKPCAPYDAETVGRPGVPPGVFFRMLFVGYFKGLTSHRAISWQCTDSRSLDDPTDDELGQFDRNRPEEKVSNDDWENPHDPDATITRMKDGTTRMAYKVEHAVDIDTEIMASTTVHTGTAPDTATIIGTAINVGRERGAGRSRQRDQGDHRRQGLSLDEAGHARRRLRHMDLHP